MEMTFKGAKGDQCRAPVAELELGRHNGARSSTAHADHLDSQPPRLSKASDSENQPERRPAPIIYKFGVDPTLASLPLRERQALDGRKTPLDDSHLPAEHCFKKDAPSSDAISGVVNGTTASSCAGSSSTENFPPPTRQTRSSPSPTDDSPSLDCSVTPFGGFVFPVKAPTNDMLALEYGCHPEYYENSVDDEISSPPAMAPAEPCFPTHESYLHFLDETFAGTDLFSESARVIGRAETEHQESRIVEVIEPESDHDAKRVEEMLREEFRKENLQAFFQNFGQLGGANADTRGGTLLLKQRMQGSAQLATNDKKEKGHVPKEDNSADQSSLFDPESSTVSEQGEGLVDPLAIEVTNSEAWDAFGNDSSADLSLRSNLANQKSDTGTESTHCSPASDDSRVRAVATHHDKTSSKSVVEKVFTSLPLDGERSIQEQFDSLTVAQRACVSALATNWEECQAGDDTAFPLEWYIRFARCSPGRPFTYKSAMGVMKRFRTSHLEQSISGMLTQLKKKTLFPIGGLKSKEGYHMLYMRPSRFVPGKTSTKTLTDNLVYAVQSMMDREEASSKGIGLVINLTSFGKSNFSFSCYRRFMKLLDGRHMPSRVQLVLLVNPPDSFGPMMLKLLAGREFRQKMRIISFDDVEDCLMEGCAEFLPEELGGKKSTDDVVREFIVERQAIEQRMPTGYWI